MRKEKVCIVLYRDRKGELRCTNPAPLSRAVVEAKAIFALSIPGAPMPKVFRIDEIESRLNHVSWME